MFSCCGQHGGRAGLGVLLLGAMVNSPTLQASRYLAGHKNIKMPNSPQISLQMLKAHLRSHLQEMVGRELRLTDTLRIMSGLL